MIFSHEQSLLNRVSLEQLEELVVPERTVRIHLFTDVSTVTLHDYSQDAGSMEDAVQALLADNGFVITGAEIPEMILGDKDDGGTDE